MLFYPPRSDALFSNYFEDLFQAVATFDIMACSVETDQRLIRHQNINVAHQTQLQQPTFDWAMQQRSEQNTSAQFARRRHGARGTIVAVARHPFMSSTDL